MGWTVSRVAGSLMQSWWDRLSAQQRAKLALAAAECRLQDGLSCQVLADTRCPVFSVQPEQWPLAGAGQVWVLPEFLRAFIMERAQ